ncbi:hypothetical protein KHA94_02005 [Bacillus sp. FJAT-49705]|uniref:Uncharacterized protein n=1 Tax=Cytobacillus citreus TaxID=2833586 RepID=A0ABS5NMH4_9BACI|nr:hypothetical protein [Cytobacillus citreus]MBS4188990.1 hypothetical protein [Cytobacillus citreus]
MPQYKVIKEHISNYPDPIVLKKGLEVLYGNENTQFPNWVFYESISTNKVVI